MDEPELHSPASTLRALRGATAQSGLSDYETWWRETGAAISRSVDEAGTPPLDMFDVQGRRIDHVRYPAGYRELLARGYRQGAVSRAVHDRTLLPGYEIGYVTSFFDPGLYCPYTVSLGTVVPLFKYGTESLRARFLPRLGADDDTFWQGATWMTEAEGGSDLGRGVATLARPDGDAWRLDGVKYFASNAGAETAVVAARPADAPEGVKGLGLFLVPRTRSSGGLNYTIRRLKDKIATRSVPTGEIELDGAEAWQLGGPGEGIYQIMEILNTSRIANAIGSVALMQRALHEASAFAERRIAFGRPVAEQPLFRRQLEERHQRLRSAFALAWGAADELEAVWLETPPYSERYHRFRLLAHLAKYWAAAEAVDTARWAMEALGGNGAIMQFGVERLLREAMILSIWEGTPHRQMLDGLQVMAQKRAHEALVAWLGEPPGAEEQLAAVGRLLRSEPEAQEAGVQPVFEALARWTGDRLAEGAAR